MQHVISRQQSYPLTAAAFWAAQWLSGFARPLRQELNQALAERSGALWRPLQVRKLESATIRDWIAGALVPDEWWRVLDGAPVSNLYRRELLSNRDPQNVRDFSGGPYGLVIRRSSIRALPTWSRGQKPADEDGFDRLQHGSLEPLTPLALLHSSADSEWWFALAPDYRGWVPKEDVAHSYDYQAMNNLLRFRGAVLLSPHARLLAPNGDTRVQMGTRLPDLQGGELPYPARKDDGELEWSKARLDGAYRLADDYLRLTPAAFFSVALTPLGQPYGWGGVTPQGPAIDCSRFVQDVFKVFGLMLPRDASSQCAATYPAITFSAGEPHQERAARLSALRRGPAILCMPGHVMLYLGRADGCHHAVHAFWAYKKPSAAGEETVPVRKVVVSSLDLGMGTSSGSLLERLTSVNLLERPH